MDRNGVLRAAYDATTGVLTTTDVGAGASTGANQAMDLDENGIWNAVWNGTAIRTWS